MSGRGEAVDSSATTPLLSTWSELGGPPAGALSQDSKNPASTSRISASQPAAWSEADMGSDSPPRLPVWRSLLRNRWFGLAAASWMEASAGTGYMFGMYSQSFKSTLGYSQRLVDGVGMAKDLGGNVGVLSGFLGDYAPAWAVLLVGALQNLLGYGMLWLALTGRIAQPSFWAVCAYICVGTNGATFFNTASLVTCVKNFPSSRGPVVGLLKGYIGLSGAIFTQVYLALYAPNREAFLLMAAWLPAAVAVLVTPLIHPLPPGEDPMERSNLALVLGGGVSLAVYLLGASLLDEAFSLGAAGSLAIAGGALLLLALPALIGVRQEWERAGLAGGPRETDELLADSKGGGEAAGWAASGSAQPKGRVIEAPGGADGRAAVVGAELAKGTGLKLRPRPAQVQEGAAGHRGGAGGEEREPLLEGDSRAPPHSKPLPDRQLHPGQPRRGEDHNLLQALASADFWLLYVAMTLASGSGLTAINNLGQIARSLGYEQGAVGVFVSLMSIWNFLGRVGGGFVSEHFVRESGVPRPLFMVATQAVMVLGHLLLAAAFPGALYLGFALVGLTYGAQWGLMPAIASELFGLRYFSTMYNWLTIANPTGSYLLSVCIAGYLYDVEAEKEAEEREHAAPPAAAELLPGESGARLCHGAHCFRVTFLIMACACVAASLASVTLTLLSRSYYAAEYAKRQTHQDAGRAAPFSSLAPTDEEGRGRIIPSHLQQTS